MPLNYILKKCTDGYKLSKLQEKINYLMYMDDIKLFLKNEKEMETLIHTVRIYSQFIGMEFGMEKCAMLVMKSGKRYITEEMELQNQDKIRTLGANAAYKYLGILEAETINQMEMKDKIQKKNFAGEQENYSRQNSLAETLSCISHYMLETTLTDYTYQERREEENLPAVKSALTHRYYDSWTT